MWINHHADQDAIVAGGVVTWQMPQLLGHQACVAGGREQVFEDGPRQSPTPVKSNLRWTGLAA